MTKKTPKTKTLADLEHDDCRWPVGDPRHEGFHFCGAQKTLGRPYCLEHWTLSLDPGKQRQHSRSATFVRRAA